MKEKTLNHYLKNKYISVKEYYSYEKTYLYHFKGLFKRFLSYPFQSLYDHVFVNCFTNNNLLNNGEVIHDFLLFDSVYRNYPVFYVANNFVDLALKTDIPPMDGTLNLFAENAIFLFKQNNSLNLTFAIVSTTFFELACINAKKKEIPEETMFQTTFVDKSSSILVPAFGTNIDPSKFIGDINNKDKSLKYINLTAQLFFYMSTYKEKGIKIIKEHSTNGVGLKKGKSKLLTPPTIGFSEKEYVENQHRLASISNPNMQGIKKQTHWRRGHWRQYENGKLTWIRPCIINPISEAS